MEDNFLKRPEPLNAASRRPLVSREERPCLSAAGGGERGCGQKSWGQGVSRGPESDSSPVSLSPSPVKLPAFEGGNGGGEGEDSDREVTEGTLRQEVAEDRFHCHDQLAPFSATSRRAGS